jgi:hypothetical protein
VFDVLVERCGLRPGASVLEIGAGSGQATLPLLARGAARYGGRTRYQVSATRCLRRTPFSYDGRMSGVLNAGGYAVVFVLAAAGLWASIDAARRPQEAWHAVGARKWLWVVGMLVGTYFLLGLIFVLLYVGGVRKDLQAVQAQLRGTPA